LLQNRDKDQKRQEFMKNNPQELKIINIVRPAIEDLGYRLVMLEFQSGILQILAEDTNGKLGLDDCTKINRVISPLLEVEDPIPGAYTLEISSPGIDRPLITGDDFNRFKGFEAKVELDMPTEIGQKRFRGVIIGEQDGLVKLLVDNAEHELELNNMKRARLVLTDELIKATKKLQTEQQEQTA
jgi:ribosome maturation factor RimP